MGDIDNNKLIELLVISWGGFLQLIILSAFTSYNLQNKRTYSAQARLHLVLLKNNKKILYNE